jgi:hypothetical protein
VDRCGRLAVATLLECHFIGSVVGDCQPTTLCPRRSPHGVVDLALRMECYIAGTFCTEFQLEDAIARVVTPRGRGDVPIPPAVGIEGHG